MVVMAARVELRLLASQSLKDKRQVVRSLIDRLPRRFPVAVAEVERQDDHRHAVIGLAVVGSDRKHLEQVLRRAAEFVAAQTDGDVVDLFVEER